MARASTKEKKDYRKIPVDVPVRYVKSKDIDSDLETRACLAMPFYVDGYEIRPPSFGVWSLLELINSKFVIDFMSCTFHGCTQALYLNHFRRDALDDVNGYCRDSDSDKVRLETEFDRKVRKWAKKITWIEDPQSWMEVREWFAYSWNGYDMFPKTGGGTDFSWYGGVSLGGMISAIGSEFGVRYDELIWDIPLCLIGHSIAQKAAQNGHKHIGRPYDEDDIKLQLELAQKRELRGELHPWQIDDPLGRCLTEEQKVNGGQKLINKFTRLQKDKRKELGIPEPTRNK